MCQDSHDGQPKDFSGLIAEEAKEFKFTVPPDAVTSTEEPWVKTMPKDLVGVALSGGGIRSATFNLGLLQALSAENLLGKVDYLSTVSGGGYVGSFWTRWRQATGHSEDFPAPRDPCASPERKAHAIRHMREFSRFLIPRVDILETELWTAFSKVVGGLFFGIVLGLTVIAAIVSLWALLAQTLVYVSADWHVALSGILFLCLPVVVFGWSEYLSVSRRKVEVTGRYGSCEYNGRAFLVVVLTLVAWVFMVRSINLDSSETMLPLMRRYAFGWRNFLPVFPLLGMFLLVSMWRLLPWAEGDTDSEEGQRRNLAVAAAYDRIQARLLSLALIWAALAGLWELGSWLRSTSGQRTLGAVSDVSTLGGTVAALSLLFASMKKWIVGTQEDRLKGGFKAGLKNFLPNVVATVAVLIFAIAIAMMLMDCAEYLRVRSITPILVLIPWMGILVFLLLVNPVALSLHEFYRARLTRCYLGAAHPKSESAAENRHTFERVFDDMLLSDDKNRPVHLVCCAANTVGEDRLSTLYRGARSAVLSRFGISIGNASRQIKGLKLSSALTASAAAFNSNMGRQSILYGRASCFLMTMLNLRLGLWVPHPQTLPKKGGGWFDTSFVRELFGWTRCLIVDAASLPQHNPSRVHLSDGAHFENLALYELVRRHCRYIIVSDCAADPSYSFGDLANAVRRIREDFGIEVEIDTNALRPKPDGFSPQHMVVGTIHYDGRNGIDKGVILFFKPVLTGDEPTDILEYRRANQVFPQQSTGDQFYSEAQWESYRRLGEHAMHTHLKKLDLLPGEMTPQRVFRSARLGAEQVPWEDTTTYRTISEACSQMEAFFRDTAPPALLMEMFSEVRAPAKEKGTSTDAFFALLRVLQTLEEMADACDLYTHWSHPLASGWMNYLRRWTNLPTLHTYWPLFKPLYASAFGSFLEDHGGLPSGSKLITTFTSYVVGDEAWTAGHAAKQWLKEKHPTAGKKLFDQSVELAGEPLQVGLACVRIEGTTAVWNWDHLYVANELRGGGFTGLLLDKLLRELPKLQLTQATVEFKREDLQEEGHRRQIVELVDFYRSREFVWQSANSMTKKL